MQTPAHEPVGFSLGFWPFPSSFIHLRFIHPSLANIHFFFLFFFSSILFPFLFHPRTLKKEREPIAKSPKPSLPCPKQRSTPNCPAQRSPPTNHPLGVTMATRCSCTNAQQRETPQRSTTKGFKETSFILKKGSIGERNAWLHAQASSAKQICPHQSYSTLPPRALHPCRLHRMQALYTSPDPSHPRTGIIGFLTSTCSCPFPCIQ